MDRIAKFLILLVAALVLVPGCFAEEMTDIAAEETPVAELVDVVEETGEPVVEEEVELVDVGEETGEPVVEEEAEMPAPCPAVQAADEAVGDAPEIEDAIGHIGHNRVGADDDKVAKANKVPALLVKDSGGIQQPLVDRTGKFFKIEDQKLLFLTC